MKDLLTNVGSGGGAAAPAAAGGAAAASGAADAPAEEEKEEGTSKFLHPATAGCYVADHTPYREGRVRRGHGFRSLRLKSHAGTAVFLLLCTSTTSLSGSASNDPTGWRGRNMSSDMDKVVSYTSHDGRDERLNDGVHVGKELVNLRTQKATNLETILTLSNVCRMVNV